MTRRLVLSYVTVAVVVLLCLEIPLGYLYARAERERLEGQVEHSAEVVGALADEAIRDGQLDRLDLLAAESAEQFGGRVVIVDGEGALLSSSHPLRTEEAQPAALPEIQAALRGQAHIGIRTSVIGGVKSLSVGVPTRPGATVRGAVRITIATTGVEARIHRLWLSLAAVGLVVLAVVMGVGFVLARWISRPVDALEQATRHLADGTLPAPASTTTGPMELRRLADTFNRTAARLQHLIAAQHSFAGHASHQLKTPLAALRLRLEILEADVPANARGTLAAALTETDRLGRMVETLLAMARIEEGSDLPVPADLDAAVEDRVRMWQPLAGQRRVQLAVTGDPVGQVYALPGALEQILDNLLANAMNAAPEGSTITVKTHRVRVETGARGDRHDTVVELHIIDQGPGMSEAQRLRAFDRFWRAPDAVKGGTGLGLALVQQLTEASGGHVELRAAAAGVDAVVSLAPVAATERLSAGSMSGHERVVPMAGATGQESASRAPEFRQARPER
ncbi:HAMP domain-containing sensor histidine kinase [Micromonospora sp. NPDC049679]|uniref:sensor histidine kinase n=1 Tax=Micromonospora sp. NPDC049679 TaxID=3155920 RepID=UPI0033D2DDBC